MVTWTELINANPQHSELYAARWKKLLAEGKDIDGEARFIDALVPRGAQILDAGCGTGRVGGYLALRGHKVWGVDIDPILIEHAKADFPQADWRVGDLANAADLPKQKFDLIFTAGNVFWFITPGQHQIVLTNLAALLVPNGRLVIAFGTGREYSFSQFFADVTAVNLQTDLLLSNWQADPFLTEPHPQASTYLVALLRNPQIYANIYQPKSGMPIKYGKAILNLSMQNSGLPAKPNSKEN